MFNGLMFTAMPSYFIHLFTLLIRHISAIFRYISRCKLFRYAFLLSNNALPIKILYSLTTNTSSHKQELTTTKLPLKSDTTRYINHSEPRRHWQLDYTSYTNTMTALQPVFSLKWNFQLEFYLLLCSMKTNKAKHLKTYMAKTCCVHNVNKRNLTVWQNHADTDRLRKLH